MCSECGIAEGAAAFLVYHETVNEVMVAWGFEPVDTDITAEFFNRGISIGTLARQLAVLRLLKSGFEERP